MAEFVDPLVEVPMEKWIDLQNEFKKDWPRSIAGYWALGTQREWRKKGLVHDFDVYCPYGDVKNGMVIIQIKGPVHNLVIQSPQDDTTILENALKATKRIDWNKLQVIPCPPPHIARSIRSILNDINMVIHQPGTPHYMYMLPKETPPFENFKLPDGVTFKLLTEEHVDIVDSTWPNKHQGSDWFFKFLIKAKWGYGIFETDELASFVFNSEIGFFTHLFTLEKFRRKGYGELLLKSVCNILFEEQKDVFCFVMDGNDSAIKLYERLGFQKHHYVLWTFLAPEPSEFAKLS